MVRLLLGAAIVSFVVSCFGKNKRENNKIIILFLVEQESEHSIPAWVEPCVILTILIANACVGIYNDYVNK